MREVWVVDLALCGLIARPAVPDAAHPARTAPTADGPTPAMVGAAVAAVEIVPPAPTADGTARPASPTSLKGAPDEGRLVQDDVDSDDASDAYSSGEDEDEPLAEVMDELERAAADLEPDVEEAVVDNSAWDAMEANAVISEPGVR